MGFGRPVIILLLAIAALWGDRGRADEVASILIGVRDDTPPFVWTEPATGDHLGFLWDICTKAVERAGYQISTRTITAAERKELLASGKPQVDLLCDATTITIGRLQTFSDKGSARDLSFSPIIFVANGTYATPSQVSLEGAGKIPANLDRVPAECRTAYEKLRVKFPEPSPETWIKMLPDAEPDETKRKDVVVDRYETWAFVEGSTIGERFAAETDTTAKIMGTTFVCLKQMPSHRKAAELFCNGHLARYIGDADIIRASIEAHAKRSGTTCAKPAFATVGSYEPYAFVTSSHNRPEFPERFSIALYEMFSDGTFERLFAGHFPGMEKSPHLATLFQINSIPEGDIQRGEQ